jgi:hypothetical protein
MDATEASLMPYLNAKRRRRRRRRRKSHVLSS